jgi:hypothetical protein
MDKELLFRPRLPEAEVEVPGVGTVRVRALNRAEVMAIQGRSGAARERAFLAAGLVDPILTEAEVGRWQQASPAGELELVTNAIGELSGMIEGAEKEAYKSLPDGSDDGVRVLPGAEVVDDGGEPAGADAR